MRIELNQGTYQIRPSIGSTHGARPVGSGNPSSPSLPLTTPPSLDTATNSTNLVNKVVSTGPTTIVREPDVAELSTIDFSTARQGLPKIDQFHAKIKPLVAGQVNRAVSFGSGPVPRGRTIYDRAYLKQVADHASINAAAVERKRLDIEG